MTTNPRITITLTGRQHDLLRAISAHSGQSMSSFVASVLDQAQPVLERIAETLRKIREAQDEQKKRIAVELDAAQDEMEPYVDTVLNQFDLFMGRVETAVGAGGDERAQRAGAGGDERAGPPPTNRGVTTPPLKTPKPASRGRLKEVPTRNVVNRKKGGKNAV